MELGNIGSLFLFLTISLVSFVVFGLLKQCNTRIRSIVLGNHMIQYERIPIVGIIFSALPLAFLLGARTIEVGTDTAYTYYPYYYLGYCKKNVEYNGIEYGFYYLFKIAYRLTHSFNGCLFIIGLVTVSLYLYAIYKLSNRNNYWLYYFLFISMFYMYSFNIARQAIAMAILLVGIWHLSYDNWRKYILFVVIATLFHTSAIISILVLAFYFTKNLGKKGQIIIIVGILCSVVLSSQIFTFLLKLGIFGKFASNYSLNVTMGYAGIFQTFKSLAIDVPLFCIIFYYNKKLDWDSVHIGFMMIITMIGLWFCVAMNDVIMRLTYYFELGYFIVLPLICESDYTYDLTTQEENDKIVRIVLLLYFVARFVLCYFIWGYDGIIPYSSI